MDYQLPMSISTIGVSGFLVFSAFSIIWLFIGGAKKLDAPLLTDESGDFQKIMKQGYALFRDGLFKIPTSNKPMVIVPTHLLDDLKTYPEETISFRREMYDRFLGKYTAVASNSEAMVQAVKSDLTRGLGNVLPTLQQATIYAAENCLTADSQDSGGWSTIKLYAATTRMIALVSGQVFVGLPLCRNEEWLDISINATIDSFVGAAMMWQYPSWSWPIMQYIVPQTCRVQHYRSRAAKLLQPLITARTKEMKDDLNFKKPSDMIQWLIDNSNGKGGDLAFQANEHIVMNIAAIHTTGGQLAHTLYDLARYPEYVKPLREEINQVLGEDGPEAVITKKALFKLTKLDSFLREVQRMNPPSMVSTNRKVLKSMKLSNGVELPVGTSLAASAGCVSRDAEIWEKPNEFDGFRFHKLRQQEGEEKYQFTSVNQDALSFGYGRHACPGRFFASAELKIILVHILRNYEVRLQEGYSKERPLYQFQEIMAAPDHTFELQFRKR
ncbi:hypothetical protein N7467_004258 [Penicillium canescens]|nr:hypothetical protein N7467_004258 [Penicillium canescens]